MKIALVHKRLDLRGGTERDLFRTAEGLRDLGHEVHLFCGEYDVAPPKNTVAHRVPVIPMGRTLRLWSFAWFGRRAVEQCHYDVVLGFGRLPRQHVLRSGGGTHRGFLERMGQAGGWTRRVWQNFSPYHLSLLAIEKRQYDGLNSRRIVAVSERAKLDIIAQYSVPAEQIAVVYNGVDLNRFHPRNREESRERIRSRWKIPCDAPVVLFVGSGFRRKGLDHLVSVWNSPRLRGVFLLVVGADARLDRYQARANRVAPGRVVFAGRQDDVENYYAAADVVALPSLQEAFGNVVLEALAAGLPVLVSRDVGAAEIMRGSLLQGIVDPNNKSEIETKLVWLLERSKDPCWMRQARSLAEEYSWENHFRRLEALLLESSRSAVDAEFNLETRGDAKIWISRSYTDPLFINALSDPDRLLSDPNCHIIKDQKKVKVGHLTVNIAGVPRSLYIKKYNAFSLHYALLSNVAQSGAVRSLRGARVLYQAGIPTVTPVAAVENRYCGIVYKSFFVSEEILDGKTADAYWKANLQLLKGHQRLKWRLAFIRQLAELFRALHAQQIYHGDLKDANILVEAPSNGRSIKLFLIDLERIRRYSRLSERRRVKNLVQLYRTLGRYVPPPQRLFFLKCYLGPSFVDRHLKRRWIRRVLRVARQVEQLKARRTASDGINFP